MNEEAAHQFLCDMRHGCKIMDEFVGVDYRKEKNKFDNLKRRLEIECAKR